MIRRGDPRGYYAALGLPVTATADEIRRAFNERAKLLHPDHAGGGDPAAFQRVLDAYEVLRDPSRRLRYDADSVDLSRDEPPAERPATSPRVDPLASPWSFDRLLRKRRPRGRPADPLGARLPRQLPVPALLAGALLAVLLVGGITWITVLHGDLVERDRRIGELTLEAERARAELAETEARYRAASVADLDLVLAAPAGDEAPPAQVFAATVTFAPGSADLGADETRQLVQAIGGLSAAVAQIPAERRWQVLIQGHAAQAAGPSGVDLSGWQLSLMRISQLVDRLVQAGLPADHVAARFSAGFQWGQAVADPGRTVELRLVCCFR
ncbi:DnaJ domain-containing protein [Geminicoccus flavidas]|uniref:DnaJ domain-containing protein n=1 Tax=Geminicoccus flavidas TaxID=2506407 RepID=UPI00190F9A7E|nr:DnaJ domain-containing protein [Geminicoccus flavidas]